MDVICPKQGLIRLVARCVSVADKRAAMPALANVLLTRDGTTLRASATDLYLSVSGHTFVDDAGTPGSVAVPAKDLLDRIKAMPDGPIQILATEGAQVTLKAVGFPRRYTLHGIPGGEFPALPKPAPDATTLTLPVEVLGGLIARTHFSMSSDETRPHVNSTLFEWEGDKVRMVTTDGHRLSKMEATVAGSSATATMLIPHKAVGELRRLAEEAKGDKDAATVTITRSGPNAYIAIAGMVFSMKLVDAQFPPYQQVIPAKTDHIVRVPRSALADALRAVSIAASDKTGGVKLTVSTGAMRITSESPESGNGFDELPVDYNGPEVTIGLNAKYLLDVLGAIDDEEVAMGISGELDPTVIRPANEPSDQGYVAVVMPMRV